MNELTMEERAKVFALYLGSKVLVSDPFNPNDPIPPEQLCGVIADPNEQFFTIKNEGMRNGFYFKDSDYQLILTPIEEASDEVLKGIARIYYESDTASWQQGRGIINLLIQPEHVKLSFPKFQSILEIIDYLREHSIHLPYKGIDLYQAGIAVKPSK